VNEKKSLLLNGLLFTEEEMRKRTEEILEKNFGRIIEKSRVIPFTYSSYYEKEMGKGIKRLWVVHEGIREIENIAQVKMVTRKLEERFSKEGKRRVNIDPGLLYLGSLVLLSTKHAPHRIYLGDGVWAELTLVFENRSFQTLPWTYPDYRDHIDFFNKIRKLFKEILRCL